jgi:hypothetical protein
MSRTRPVAGSTRATVRGWPTTQTLRAPTATPPGTMPTGQDRVIRLVRGSTSNRRPADVATQIPALSDASPEGTPASGMVAAGCPLPGSILVIVLSVTFATQTDPNPNAMASGPLPDRIVATTSPATGLTSETVPLSVFATQTSPPPTVTAAGPGPTGMRSTTCQAELT